MMIMSKTVSEAYPITKFNGIAINKSILSSRSNYYSYSSRNVKYIVMHYTGNSSDTAKANANYFSGGSRGASAHYFVDENSCYQSVALHNAAWAVGGTNVYKHADCRNLNSISIEMCCSGNYIVSDTTITNAAYLCAALCKYVGISANEVDTYVLRHYDVWNKSCPAQWASAGSAGWTAFKEKVKSILNGSEELTMAQYEELKQMIQAQKPMIYDYMDDNMPSWAKPTIQKLMDKGFLVGDDEGRLGLTMDAIRIFVANDRAGLYD